MKQNIKYELNNGDIINVQFEFVLNVNILNNVTNMDFQV